MTAPLIPRGRISLTVVQLRQPALQHKRRMQYDAAYPLYFTDRRQQVAIFLLMEFSRNKITSRWFKSGRMATVANLLHRCSKAVQEAGQRFTPLFSLRRTRNSPCDDHAVGPCLSEMKGRLSHASITKAGTNLLELQSKGLDFEKHFENRAAA